MSDSALGTVGRILREHILAKGATYTNCADTFVANKVPRQWIDEQNRIATQGENVDFELPPGDWDFERGLAEQSAAQSEKRAEGAVYQATVEDFEEAEEQVDGDGPDGWPVTKPIN